MKNENKSNPIKFFNDKKELTNKKIGGVIKDFNNSLKKGEFVKSTKK